MPKRANPNYRGVLADPEFRRRRAIKAAQASHSVEASIRRLVEAAPDLTQQQRDQLAAIARGGRTSDPETGTAA